MTRKDYRRMSEELKEQWENIPANAHSVKRGFNMAVWGLERALRADNYRFDESRFRDAIYGKKSKP